MENDDTTRMNTPQAKSKTAHFPTPSHHEPPKNLTQTFSVANK